MPQPPLVERTDLGAIAKLTIRRAERRNALSRALVEEISDALDAIAASSLIRVLVLGADGPVFCAGMDLNEVSESLDGPGAEERAVSEMQALADLYRRIHTLPQVSIAVVRGAAYGGGAGLAVACDFVFMAEGAVIGYPEVRRGLVGAIVAADLVRQVGDRRARELLLLGEAIDAETAVAWGLVNASAPLDELDSRATGVAERLLAGGPRALAISKRLVDQASGRLGDLRGAAAESALVRCSAEAREGIAAFREKRSPRWHGSVGPG
jgi:methylglutaconyl-CoA hydratase